MNPTLEQIETDESVWPDGADFYIPESGIRHAYFIKKIGSDLVYKLADFPDNWARHKSEIPLPAIPRPTKAFAPEVGFHGECTYAGRVLECVVVLNNRVCIFDKVFEVITAITPDLDIRPTKSECDCFIEEARKATNADKEDHVATDMFSDMFVAGCRFMEPTK